MQQITRENFLGILTKKYGEILKLEVKGDRFVKFSFSKFDYNIEDDILEIQDMLSNNLMSFNLNNVNFIGKNDDEVICVLEDRADTIIKIK